MSNYYDWNVNKGKLWMKCKRIFWLAAKARKYNPDVDKSVMDYFYSKVDLEKTANSRIRTQDLVDEIWLGLPDEFQVLFNYHTLCTCSLSELGRVFADKDLPFHATWRNQHRRRDSRRDD